ncbi:FtsK/SpoIIIE domain-containing protein [Microbacterium luticocti]|uniref:FtsK/SpoIIIE domain-containing protein n=1 Tax=Microbacterium luticocti TaxID=451764 RepID=UPI0003FACE78|nr:FtsK/SpoIIIE domain-containing protein [Microbacterium luticocti]
MFRQRAHPVPDRPERDAPPADPFPHAGSGTGGAAQAWPDVLGGPDADAPLRLPTPAPPPRRSGVPLVASAVPVLGALALWLATGTVMMLWFAALGPLIAVASLLDARRTARRDRRRAAADAARARRRAASAVASRHEHERRALWSRHPDVHGLLRPAAHGGDEVWRAVAGRGDDLVVGRGAARSAVRVEGGDEGAETAALRRRAAVLDDAPVTVRAEHGVAVVGPEPAARAVLRALVLQLCLALPPDRLRVVEPADPADPDAAWLARLPHAGTGPARDGVPTLAVTAPGDGPVDADIVLARVRPGEPAPPRCRCVLTLTGVGRARLRGDGDVRDVRVEAVGAGQAHAIAAALAARAEAAYGWAERDEPVGLADLLPDESAPAGGLVAVVGTARSRPFRIDLVADGPHAVVAGVTGSGKSELLTTWVTALCARYRTDEVAFLLADFKGGTAFDALAGLPHVTGVITDLDAGGAQRALQSLRAELRRREAEIVRAGARDIDGTGLPRLVIVVDEFAALLAGHPELQDLFTDIAARGRALGMHLILGTQRAAGAFREGLLANCPLRISLRVTDAADSRLLLGCDDAAVLPGTPDQRGIALVRRAADTTPHTVRIALSSAQLVARTAAGARGPVPRRPWMPPLPESLALDEAAVDAPEGIVLGRADDPDRQRQDPVVLGPLERGLGVVGRAGSGRTAVAALVAAQARRPVWIPADAEAAWDEIDRLAEHSVTPGTVVIVDDLDALLARYPLDYAQAVAQRLERVVHAAGPGGGQVVFTAQRLAGATARLIELLPRRALLAAASRAEFVAAGGPGDRFDERMPPGRALLEGRLVHFALPPVPPPVPHTAPTVWDPRGRVTAVVARPGPAARAVTAVAARHGVPVLDVEAAAADTVHPAATSHPGDTDAPAPAVIVGDGDGWQRAWRLLQTVRGTHDLLVDAACAAEYRLLTGLREPPPYCTPGRSRAWLLHAGGPPVRVVVDDGDEAATGRAPHETR